MVSNKISCIYQIHNLITNDCYIGSTENWNERLLRHRRDLLNNKHHSIVLQRAYNKYGLENFDYRILLLVSKENLIIEEQKFFELFKPIYNIAKFAGSPRGIKHTQESSDKKRKYAIENNVRPPSHTWENKRKRVIALDKETGEELISFNSISDACFFVGRNHRYVSTITEVCNGSNPRRKTAYGYKWKWA